MSSTQECSEQQKIIEELEYKYLNELHNVIRDNICNISESFARRFDLYNYWKEYLETEKKRLTDLGIGAERVFWKLIAEKFKCWIPVPVFIGSNLFFETKDAFINIDIKTAYIDNERDYVGVVEVGDAQTSYPMKNKYGAQEEFKPKMKTFYVINDKKKYSLAYFIQVLYEKPEKIMKNNLDKGPVAIVLISMPNGELYNIYGEKIVGYPKSYKTQKGIRMRPMNYRYFYTKIPHFICLPDNTPCKYRFRVYFNKKYVKYKIMIGLKQIVLDPWFIINMRKGTLSDTQQECFITYF